MRARILSERDKIDKTREYFRKRDKRTGLTSGNIYYKRKLTYYLITVLAPESYNTLNALLLLKQ